MIHGCYSNGRAHALTVIDTARTSRCPAGTTSLNWNQTGPQGPAGPQYAASALVLGDGTFQVLTKSSGVTVSVTRNGPGQWTLNASGLGNGCPLPALSSGGPAVTYFTNGRSGGGSVTLGVATSDNQDQPWSFTLVGVQSGAAGAAAASASMNRSATGR